MTPKFSLKFKGAYARTGIIVVLALIASTIPLGAQEVLLSAGPGMGYPITPSGLYSLEAGGSIDLGLSSQGLPIEGLARLGYSSLIIKESVGTVSVVKLEGGISLPLIKSPSFSLGPSHSPAATEPSTPAPRPSSIPWSREGCAPSCVSARSGSA
jgi:hypothetical protein